MTTTPGGRYGATVDLGNLIMKRNVGEKIQIGEAMVTIVSICGKSVKIAIEAPSQVHIKRVIIPQVTK